MLVRFVHFDDLFIPPNNDNSPILVLVSFFGIFLFDASRGWLVVLKFCGSNSVGVLDTELLVIRLARLAYTAVF